MLDLPTIDELRLAENKLALATGDIDWFETAFRDGADPEQDSYPKIDLELVGAVLLFAQDCKRVADKIVSDVNSIARNVEAIYYGDVARDRSDSDRARELLAGWHRESIASESVNA